MAGQNSAKTAKPKLAPRGRPFVAKDPRINMGGRPKGFGALIREKTRNGEELVEFGLAVLRADVEKLLPRNAQDAPAKDRARMRLYCVPVLRDRLEAKRWLSDQGWGKAPVREEGRELSDKSEQELIEALAREEGFVDRLVAERTRLQLANAPTTAAVQ